MDLPSETNPIMSDKDVVPLGLDELQNQLSADIGKAGPVQKTSINTDLWDSLWKPAAPVVDAGVSQAFNPVVNQVVTQVANPVFCLACDTMFNNRRALENHTCPFASFICSCGISFSKYPEMWSHSSSHNHKSVVSNKNAIYDSVSKYPDTWSHSSSHNHKSMVSNRNAIHGSVNGQEWNVPTPLPSFVPRYLTGQTVNLWRRFKPVVKLETLQSFTHRIKYLCAICCKGICSQDKLIEHVATAHSSTCIYGCRRCGLLLIGSIPPKPQHRCGSFYTRPPKWFTIGQVQRNPLASGARFTIYACPFCTLKFSNAVHLNNHMRLNHSNISYVSNISKLLRASAKRPRTIGAKVAPRTAPSAPSAAWRLQKQRCALCGKSTDSIKMLGEHRCTRKLYFIDPKTAAMPVPQTPPQRPGSAESSGGGSTVTFRFQDLSNTKTHGHTKLLTINTEPVEVNLKMTQDFSHRMSVIAEPELHSDDKGAERTSAEINGLFYQKCSAPTSNNLNYLLSHI